MGRSFNCKYSDVDSTKSVTNALLEAVNALVEVHNKNGQKFADGGFKGQCGEKFNDEVLGKNLQVLQRTIETFVKLVQLFGQLVDKMQDADQELMKRLG